MNKSTIPIISFILLFMSCSITKDISSDKIPFAVIKSIFVNNKINEISNPKIETEQRFNEVFGIAPIAENPPIIDYKKQYVIAIVKPVTNSATEIHPISLNKKNGYIEFVYKVEKGEQLSYQIQPNLAIIVDKKHQGKIILIEQ